MNKSEPIIEEQFIYRDFPCVIIFQPMLHRCGYVGIPESHKLYGKNYTDINVECHGGLTYSKDYLVGYGRNTGMWWIGFDCAHYMDAKDFETAYEIYKNQPECIELINKQREFELKFRNLGEVRSLEYCELELEYIVDQIIEKGNEL